MSWSGCSASTCFRIATLISLKKSFPTLLQVNNAARFHFGPLEKAPADAWQRLWSTNVVGYAMLIREALPHFRKHGKGSVVNMASVSSFVVSGDGKDAAVS